MQDIDPALVGLFQMQCVGVSAAFLCLVFVMALTRRLYGVVENDHDWNG